MTPRKLCECSGLLDHEQFVYIDAAFLLAMALADDALFGVELMSWTGMHCLIVASYYFLLDW
jgi:hypothetical protein